LLSSEPCVYPDDLFQQPASLARPERRWWVVHTRARAEKSLARAAAQEDIAYFLPLHQHRWRKEGRLFRSWLPLFPGYLFLHADEQERVQIQETRWVAHVLPVGDQEGLQEDLLGIYHALCSGVPLTPERHLVVGARVLITTGPLAGLEGTILHRREKVRLLLEVRFMKQGVSVEVEDWMVAPAEARTTERTPAPC
jgi:transcription antitermination factor NusG